MRRFLPQLIGASLALGLPLSASLIGHWPLDELSGTTAGDASGNNNDGTNTGGGLTWETGMIAGGARLDGASTAGHDFILSPIPQMAGATALTITCWVKSETNNSYKGLVMTRDATDSNGPNANWGVARESGEHIDGRIDGQSIDSSTGSVPAGEWHHVALVWDGVAKTRRLYIDGVADPTSATTTNSPTSIVSSGVWYFGLDSSSLNRHFGGVLDDIAMWDTPLNAGDIATIHSGGLLGLNAPAALAGDPPPTAQDYYVAPGGNDANSGNIGSPLQSIAKAAQLARPGDTVFLRAGTYREKLIAGRSGTAADPITFTAYNSENVILTTAEPATTWTVHSGDIWKATVPWDAGTGGDGNTLFVDGNLKFEARQGAENDPMDFSNWGQIPSGKLTSDYFTPNDLSGWGDDFWNGATVRYHTHDWVIRESIIADYRSSDGRVTFDSNIGVTSQKHTLGYTIFGTLLALNEPGEWFKDTGTDTLYYQVDPGQDPNTKDIEFKQRDYCADVRGSDYIRITGLTMRGGTIDTDSGTDYNLWDNNTIYAWDKANYGRAYISGSHNVFRDNEISQSWGSMATVNGTRQSIINNYIHDIGFNGTSRVVSMSGEEHFVSRNTVQNFARSFLDGYPNRSEFSYNIFDDGANLSWDTGVFDGDSGRGNGGGCIVHHNIFRHSNSLGIYCSFYAGLDLVIHHNIVYNLTPTTMRGGQLNFSKYYHNTLIGPKPDGDTNAASYAYESSYSNNIQLTTEDIASLGVQTKGNHDYSPSDFVNFAGDDYRLTAASEAIDKGIVLPGINDGYAGAAPDAGALEFGETLWPTGHDFLTPPYPVYAWLALPGTNIYDNGQFRNNDSATWTNTGTPVFFNANTWNTVSSGLSYIGGYAYQLEPGDGIARTFSGLKPNTWYTVASETRLVDQRIEAEQFNSVSGSPVAGDHRGEDYLDNLADGDWLAYNSIDFGPSGKYDLLELSYARPPGSPKTDPQASLEVRLGSPTGTLLGEFIYNWNAIDTWRATNINIPPTSGPQTVYLLAKGSGANLMRLAAVRLLKSNVDPDDKITIGIRNHGFPQVSARDGLTFWRGSQDDFNFKTGPAATSAELFIQNDGLYDAYLDRLAFFEKENFTTDATNAGTPVQSTTQLIFTADLAINDIAGDNRSLTTDLPDSWWQIDLGAPRDLYGLKLTAPLSIPEQLSNYRVSVWNTDPRDGGNALWEREYFTGLSPSPGETLVIKATDLSTDGTSELQQINGRFIRVQLLGLNNQATGRLGIAEIEALTFDHLDLVVSDGIAESGSDFWQAVFPQVVNVGEISLLNRSDSLYPELSNFNVTVWNGDPDNGGTLVWQQDYFPTGSVGQGETFLLRGDGLASDGFTRLASVIGTTVRVKLNGTNSAGTNTFTLADAAVRSAEHTRPANNIALQGLASQSSNHYADQGFAEDAINSIVNPEGDFTTTQNSSQPWWQVDLQQTPVIDQIVLFNRTDAAERIGNFTVSVWTDNPETTGVQLWTKNYAYSNGDLPAGGSLTIQGNTTSTGLRLDQVVGGRFVRVRLQGSNLLSLAEVQVWTTDSILRLDEALTSLDLDFGTPTSPVASGYSRLSPATHGDAWWGSTVSAIDRGTIIPPNDANRDFNTNNGPASLNLKVQNGLWTVTMNMGDDDLPHEDMMVWAEDSLISADIDSPAGQFSYVDTSGASTTATNFTVNVIDGEMNLHFDDNGGPDPSWVLNSLSLALTPNTPPLATSFSINVEEGHSIPLTLSGSDADGHSFTYRLETLPTHGTLTGTAPNLTYTADFPYTGSDTLTYVTRDPYIDSSLATVSITVDPDLDYDDDGLPNDWELLHFGDATSANPGDDDDNDGFTNLDEFIAGTIPTDNSSYLSITVTPETSPGTGVVISWPTTPGRTYSVLRSVDLESPFTPLQSGLPDTQTSFTDPTPPLEHAFYRVGVTLP